MLFDFGNLRGKLLLKFLNLAVVIDFGVFAEVERVLQALKELCCLSSELGVCASEHVVRVLHRVVSIYSIVFLHHQDSRVHLSLLEGLTSHATLELYCSHRIDALDVPESSIDLLLF